MSPRVRAEPSKLAQFRRNLYTQMDDLSDYDAVSRRSPTTNNSRYLDLKVS